MSLYDLVPQSTLRKKISEFTPQDYDNYREACGKWADILDISKQRKILSSFRGPTRLKQRLADHRGDRYIALCVSPNLTKNKFEKFREKCLAFLKRKCFKRALCVFEQRGSCEMSRGNGIHVHYILERNLDVTCSHIRRYSKNSFKRFCDTNNSNFFHFKPFSTKYLKDKIDYLRPGSKTGDGKAQKQQQDILWRQDKNLEDFYVNNWPEILQK